MPLKPLVPLALIAALAGCSVAAAPPTPDAATSALQATATASLPFKTIAVDDAGQGNFFQAGASETAVLRSQAELDAFMARHPRSIAPPAGMPAPDASPTPPSGIPFGTPTPPYVAPPFPPTLSQVDFGRYVVLAFFDGQVKVASMSRITGVREAGDRLVATTRRWEPPAGPNALPDTNGRLHVIALPRTDKAVTFTAPDVVDGTSKRGGGYGIGGNPIMRPQWPAVPNPEITREMIEQTARGWLGGSTLTSFDLQLAPIATAKMEGVDATMFTPDSLVWIARAKGEIQTMGPGAVGPGVVGGGPPTTSESVMLLSPEDGNLFMAASFGDLKQNPGFSFHLLPLTNLFHLGEPLRFETQGTPATGSLTITLRSGTATPVVTQVPYADLAGFSQPLDAAHVPFLTGASLQPLTVELKYGEGATETHEGFIARDPATKDTPPMRVMGSGNLADYRPEGGESAADAFVRDIAIADWQGSALTFTHRDATLAEVRTSANEAVELAPTTPVRVYEVTGTFPTFLVPAVTASTNVDEAMAPSKLRIVVTPAVPVRVVSLKAFAR